MYNFIFWRRQTAPTAPPGPQERLKKMFVVAIVQKNCGGHCKIFVVAIVHFFCGGHCAGSLSGCSRHAATLGTNTIQKKELRIFWDPWGACGHMGRHGGMRAASLLNDGAAKKIPWPSQPSPT